MEPFKSWERHGKIRWHPDRGVFIDQWTSKDISGPIYFVTVRIDTGKDTGVRIIREQRALIPSLAAKRVREHYEQYLPAGTVHVVLVRRGRALWSGWQALARVGGFPVRRDIRKPKTNGH
jgi:hypothetical protein